MINNKCVIKGCDRPIRYKKHGLCNTHTQRFYRKGTPGEAMIKPKRKREAYRVIQQGGKDAASKTSREHDA